jgi:hypothetical protein
LGGGKRVFGGPKCADCGELLILNNCWECNPGGHAAQRGANKST